jgi:predicted SprT family Zn-dependent metalloprotease
MEFPDARELFMLYDDLYFHGLLGCVELVWSTRMTLCAGLCCYKDGLITIKLSEPLLKFRSVEDMKETLLHEMIHAFMWVTGTESGRDGHGSAFLEMMELINLQTGLSVTVRHSFTDEVDHYRTHIWLCDGPCRSKPPFYGYVKRAMNRPPSETDNWCKR